MTVQSYLNRLIHLKLYLKEHPEFRKIYSDINIDMEIARTKHELYKTDDTKEETDSIDQQISYTADFVSCNDSPF